MRRPSRALGALLGACFFMVAGCAGLTEPTATVTSTAGPDIQQATLEAYDGPKARIAVSKFTVKAAKAYGQVGEGLADMLATVLFQTNRYVVLERQALADVLAEQDLGASGRIRAETAAKIGQIEGAELLVVGTVTEFEPGSAGGGASVGGSIGSSVGSVAGYGGMIIGQILGSLAGSVQTSHVAIDLRLVDTRTSRIVAATSVQGKATDIAGLGSIAGPDLGVGLSGYAKTPMEKAARIAIQEGVKFVVSRTPSQYLRHTDTPVVPAAASPPPMPALLAPGPASASPVVPVVSPPVVPLSPSATSVMPPASAPPASETTPLLYIKTAFANMRAAPDTKAKVVAVLKKGTRLTIVDMKEDWYRVKMEDGKDGWVVGSAISLEPE